MQEERGLHIPSLLEVIDEEIKVNLTALAVDEVATRSVLLFLIQPLQNIRFPLLCDDLAISDTWKTIRQDMAVFDLITGLTSTLKFHANYQETDGWKKLSKLVVDAIAVFNNDSVDYRHASVADTGEFERFSKTDFATITVNSNPWLVTLFLMRMTPSVKEKLTVSSRLVTKTQANAGKTE